MVRPSKSSGDDRAAVDEDVLQLQAVVQDNEVGRAALAEMADISPAEHAGRGFA